MHRFGRPHSQQEMRFPSIHKSHKKHWVPYLYKKCVTQQDDEQFAEDKKKKERLLAIPNQRNLFFLHFV
jgi:hypothetical protein